MKTSLLLTTILFGVLLSSYAQQVEDSIEMMPSYTNESYYSMANDEQVNVDNTNWDIAFDVSAFGSSIRTNGHTGTEVYVYANGTDWASVDTTGMVWNSMYNSETKWEVGAFNQSYDPSNQFDLGWGVYNMVTHHITGDSIHIIKLASGDYKKLMIESLASGIYTFKHADLDGANEVTNTVTKNNFAGKNFAYYSITNDMVIDREPNNTTWDIVFTKYVAKLGPSIHYGVTGVLSNNGVHVRKASGIDPSAANYYDFTVDSVINVIGWDWKSFNMTTFAYEIAPDLSYFVEDQSGDIWHIVFTKFAGSSTGKVVFTKERVSTAGIDPLQDITSFGIYPNPADDQATLLFDSSVDQVDLSILDLGGKIVLNEQITQKGFVSYPVSLTGLKAGTYLVRLTTKKGTTTRKLFVR